jgi:hypothetical protein
LDKLKEVINSISLDISISMWLDVYHLNVLILSSEQ